MKRKHVVSGAVVAWALVSAWVVLFNPAGVWQALVWNIVFLVALLMALTLLRDALKQKRKVKSHSRAARVIADSFVRQMVTWGVVAAALLLVGMAAALQLNAAVAPAFFAAAFGIVVALMIIHIDRKEVKEQLSHERLIQDITEEDNDGQDAR